tara:strand:- start:66 stop:494 length:429 start_codon:yes stop_codon:yes gene_type:complete
MRIYKIISPNTDLVYVGKTDQTLNKRLSGHRSKYKAWLAGKSYSYYCSSYKVLEHGDYSIELIEETDREGYWIKEMNTCNIVKFDHDHAAYNRAYKAANRESLNEKKREKVPCSNCGRAVNRSSMTRHKGRKVCKNMTETSQ